jgi:hypothetical protein
MSRMSKKPVSGLTDDQQRELKELIASEPGYSKEKKCIVPTQFINDSLEFLEVDPKTGNGRVLVHKRWPCASLGRSPWTWWLGLCSSCMQTSSGAKHMCEKQYHAKAEIYTKSSRHTPVVPGQTQLHS